MIKGKFNPKRAKQNGEMDSVVIPTETVLTGVSDTVEVVGVVGEETGELGKWTFEEVQEENKN
ncbi:hypothetical protein Glove_880g1 [Diversispora epigaea]|uniref:Uncharacterized protein n=1 Tax=Diversispora epigaea TaxID=1348612 RepID=A0A397FY74_9GLOM|nr:hypothetical protein Glove_880g1 [Diversispora epigaea]